MNNRRADIFQTCLDEVWKNLPCWNTQFIFGTTT